MRRKRTALQILGTTIPPQPSETELAASRLALATKLHDEQKQRQRAELEKVRAERKAERDAEEAEKLAFFGPEGYRED